MTSAWVPGLLVFALLSLYVVGPPWQSPLVKAAARWLYPTFLWRVEQVERVPDRQLPILMYVTFRLVTTRRTQTFVKPFRPSPDNDLWRHTRTSSLAHPRLAARAEKAAEEFLKDPLERLAEIT